MFSEDTVYLKVTISKEVSNRFRQYLMKEYPNYLRGPLSEEVEKALILYLESKDNTRTHMDTLHEKQEQELQTTTIIAPNSTNNNTKYDILIETIKRFSF